MEQGVFVRSDPVQNARFVGIEVVAQGDHRLADPVGIRQHGLLGLQFGLFARTKGRGREFVALEAEPLLVAAACGGLLLQLGQPAARLAHPCVGCAVGAQQLLVAGQRVERRDPELLGGEDQVLVLRMDVQQPGAQLAQQRQLHGHVVDEGAALAGGGDHAADGGFGGEVEVVRLEKRLESRRREVEHPFDDAVARAVLDGRSVVLVARKQSQRTQEDRFSGTRLSRDDVQPRLEFHFEPVDQRIVFNRQTK